MTAEPLTPEPLMPAAIPATRRWFAPGSLMWPMLAIALLAGLHFAGALGRAINWDEFNHYWQVHQMLRGEMTAPLQTLQIRAFGWITQLPLGNIDQIIAARIAMFGFVLIAAGAIYAAAHGFASRKVALICALAWLSAGFVLQHGTSFRPDAMAAALLMSSLALMIRTRLGLGVSLLMAILAALALLVTIKSVLYAPAFAGIAWLRWQEAGRSRAAGARLVLLAVLVGAAFALFYSVHAALLPEAASSTSMAAGSAAQMFRPLEMPYWRHMVKAAATAPFLAAAIALLPLVLWRNKTLARSEKLALAGLALPLAVLLFYVNTYAYFFVFILAPVAVGCAIVFETAIARYSLLVVSAALAINGAGIWAIEEGGVQARQRQIIAAAAEIFPEPVRYFDFPGMLGHFHKANGFFTQWGVDNYRRRGSEFSMASTMAREPVPLVIENDTVFTDVLRGTGPVLPLLAEDVTALRDTYISFWGPFWLAGEELGAGEARLALIRVPGPYTVRGGPVVVDGVTHPGGAVVSLHRRQYRLSAPAGPARLIWGERLAVPATPAPQGPHWTQF